LTYFPRPSHRNELAPNARPDRHALRPLTLWGFEGSPFVRPVREALSSLGLRYTLVSCARGSANRDRMFRKTGHFQAPYLEDPNTGVCMYESGEIVRYLTAYTVPAAAAAQR
jgi:glutathione S-transferase